MHLLAPLSSGIANAPLGTAILKLRGTGTDAAYWTDFEGAVAGVTGTPVPLDSYGSAEVYVNALVDVTVKNVAGVTVREFTAGDSAPAVEVRSLSFTGVPYGGGGAAPGEPTTLQAIADLWLTSAGTIDWKVMVNGVAYTLSTALSNAALGLVFNVKSTSYAGGAVGDGATNDAPAVAAAVTACAAAGGGIVWFPPGTYRLNSSITVPGGVVMMGAGANLSFIQVNQIVGPGFDCSASSVGQKIYGLTFSHVAAAAQNLIRFTATKLDVSECELIGSNTTTTLLASTAATAITLNCENVVFRPGNNRKAIDTSSVVAADQRSNLSRLMVVAPATNAAQRIIDVPGAIIVGSVFDMSGVASGAPRVIEGANGGIVVGCRFLDAPLSVVWYGISCPESASGVFFMEAANEFGQGTDPLNGHAYDFTTTEAQLSSREGRWIEITESVSGGAITLFMKEFGRVEHYNSNSGASGSIDADGVAPSKGCCDVVLKRVNGASGGYTANTTYFQSAWTTGTFATQVFAGRFYAYSHSSFTSPRWARLNFTRE
jgi:hypothetical protein